MYVNLNLYTAVPNAAALVDEKTNKKVMFDDGVIEDKERKMTVAGKIRFFT